MTAASTIGFILGVMSLTLSIFCVISTHWVKATPTGTSQTSVVQTFGLWQKCETITMGGFMSCNLWNMPISSMPPLLLSLQIMMVSGAIFEILGVCASIYTLKICLNCSQRRVRNGGMIAGTGHLLGSLLILTSGILALVIVIQNNYYKNESAMQGGGWNMVTNNTYNMVLGYAAYFAWAAGFLAMGAMGCMYASACSSSPEEDDIYQPKQSYYNDQGYYQPGKPDFYAAYDPASLPRQNTYRSYY
ncbi:Oidioi.mRNA.OKI2018_I69.PAR.g9166.t1.cds [Oikopleura dioica]|uniref:Claudin n=1 Tax=Oikopleura dioica TaxID=34765 RepID=A0ABN7RJE5_OIKDI|nr:Oidioi.mRNA.OKI2018_I69.PAR.g9166.t1.cds [Oikopleura dioica]